MTGLDVNVLRNDEQTREHQALLTLACDHHGLTLRQRAYVLATARHESKMGRRMVVQESGWADEDKFHLGNIHHGDGHRYRGRGYVPLRGRLHYGVWDRRLGVPLLQQPELAADAAVAAEIAVQAMMAGTFTGVGLADFINDEQCDYLGARQVVNGRDRADLVARYARHYEAAMQTDASHLIDRALVLVAQRHLRRIGWPVVVDGILGTTTRAAIADFQRGYTYRLLEPTGALDGKTRDALEMCARHGGHASPNFRFVDFRTGGSTLPTHHNRVISIERGVLRAMECLQQHTGRRVVIASGYRSAAFNRHIGANANSAHLRGLAVDIAHPRLPVDQVTELGVFTGVGARHGVVEHLEVSPTADPADPTVFELTPS